MRHIFNVLFLLVFSQSDVMSQSAQEEVYGSHLVSFSPMVAFGSSSFGDFGVGLGYEHFFNPKVALQSEFAFGIENNMVQLLVGPKFYPRTHENRVSYGLAPVFLLTRGENDSGTMFHDVLFYNGQKLRTHYQFGFMLINSVNMTLNERIYFGIEAGLGINYINRYKMEGSNDFSENDPGGNRLIRIKMGFRL